jgi:anthranilate phosphoribosyltransferase
MIETMREAIVRVVSGGTLTSHESHAVMSAIMTGETSPDQMAALLTALAMRGETTDELVGFARAMREQVVDVAAPTGTIDIVGTGGDGSGTFNISTAAALLTAACGVVVAKHGNRAVTSRAGSADVLDALGIRIDHDAASAATALQRHGFAFLFAPTFHPAMRHAAPVRAHLGIRTAFNLLGPLTNPASVRRIVVGVAADAAGSDVAARRIADILLALGVESALVVSGAGIDELPLDGRAIALRVDSTIRAEDINLDALGLRRTPISSLSGGDAITNAAVIESLFLGRLGARRDVVVLNAAAGLLVAGRVQQMSDGVHLAASVIDSGAAANLLATLRRERQETSA